jgi:hypothetical protein
MPKTVNKAKASTSSPAGATKKAVKAKAVNAKAVNAKAVKAKAVASAAKKGIKANPVAALKKNLKGKSPLAAGKSAASSSSGRGSAQKSEANLVNTVCRQVNEMLGRELESMKVNGLAGKAVAEGVCRMLGKDYRVDSQKSLALAMVIMCDAKLLTDTQRMKQLGLKALTDNQMATLKVCVRQHFFALDFNCEIHDNRYLKRKTRVYFLCSFLKRFSYYSFFQSTQC